MILLEVIKERSLLNREIVTQQRDRGGREVKEERLQIVDSLGGVGLLLCQRCLHREVDVGLNKWDWEGVGAEEEGLGIVMFLSGNSN